MVGIFVLNFYIHYKLVNTGVSPALRPPGGWWGAVTDALIIGSGENALSCDFFCTNAIR